MTRCVRSARRAGSRAAGSWSEFQAVLNLNTALTLGGAGGTVELRCSDGDAAVTTTWQHVSISAFKLPKLTSIDLTP
jgi:hypothetical protein